MAACTSIDRKLLLVADAYYASEKMIGQLLTQGHQLVTRSKSNAADRATSICTAKA